MFRCSGNSSICLTTFPVKAAAVVSVNTIFLENPIAGLLGRADTGLLGRGRRATGLRSRAGDVAAGRRGGGLDVDVPHNIRGRGQRPHAAR